MIKIIDYDICWCADSPKCEYTECFRHTSHMAKPEPGIRIIGSYAYLQNTKDCEYNKGGLV